MDEACMREMGMMDENFSSGIYEDGEEGAIEFSSTEETLWEMK